ncbi:hypothetical protein DPM13_01000 [Paracoccus mutanolyticus]|uniref:Transposase n=1 Tax=Paracoccus mutanolyticus TaxID=1499308 RepID=A0ABN5M7J3_9RHOB|nr:hypothetical protein DPM13_01000 [Paracoccus mutanolyticus]
MEAVGFVKLLAAPAAKRYWSERRSARIDHVHGLMRDAIGRRRCGRFSSAWTASRMSLSSPKAIWNI